MTGGISGADFRRKRQSDRFTRNRKQFLQDVFQPAAEEPVYGIRDTVRLQIKAIRQTAGANCPMNSRRTPLRRQTRPGLPVRQQSFCQHTAYAMHISSVFLLWYPGRETARESKARLSARGRSCLAGCPARWDGRSAKVQIVRPVRRMCRRRKADGRKASVLPPAARFPEMEAQPVIRRLRLGAADDVLINRQYPGGQVHRTGMAHFLADAAAEGG